MTGVPVLDGELTPRDFQRAAPGSMPWRDLHPVPTGIAAAAVVVAVVVAGVIAWFDATDRPPFDDRPPRGVETTTADAQDSLVAAARATIEGDWAEPAVRLVTCDDDQDRKGWSRWVELELAATMDQETGEDVIDTPVRTSERPLDDVARLMVDRGLPEPYRDGDAEISSTPDGRRGASSLQVSFTEGRGDGRVLSRTSCES